MSLSLCRLKKSAEKQNAAGSIAAPKHISQMLLILICVSNHVQVPFLIDGTVRENLDPKSEHTDQELLAAIHEVGLAPKLLGLDQQATLTAACEPKGALAVEISHTGTALSHSEKQLLCLARAILEPCKCLLLDEFTSGVHSETEVAMRDIISKHFADASVIEIAHSLHGIKDYDLVAIVEHGQVVEQGRPAALLSDKGTVFSSMFEAMA